MTMTPLPNAQQSFKHALAVSLTPRQNQKLWDMLSSAAMHVIRHREYLTSLDSTGHVDEFLRYCGVSNELFALRNDLTAALYDENQ